ncbi:MAG: site-2 protease family protein [Anaerolineaceae bacterium]
MDAYTYPLQMNDLVEQVFVIENITLGSDELGYQVRYRGHLRSTDSDAAYDILRGLLQPKGFMPLFRIEEGSQVVEIVKSLPVPKPSNPWINLLLFVLTILSVLVTGAFNSDPAPMPSEPSAFILAMIARGWPFAVSILAILGAHEFGHYFAGRLHKTQVSLPYFLPFPFSAFGTLGAFINMKEPPRNRRILLDISIAGPLAGLAVAIPVLLLGLSLSRVEGLPVDSQAAAGLQLEGNSVLYLLSKFFIFGQLLPAPQSYGDVSPILFWIKYFFTGQPLPLGGMDVMLHPMAWAGWGGLLVTALNLIPAGQLDGGHILFVLFGRQKSLKVLPAILVFLIGMGFLWSGWWLWAALVFLFGRYYAEPPDMITKLNPGRKVLAVFALVVFLLVFTPVPLIIF